MKLNNIRLLVKDFDICFCFYRDTMRLKPTWGAEGEGFASFEAGEGSSLDLFSRDAMAEALGTVSLNLDAPVQDRAVLVFEAEDLEAEVARLDGMGVSLIAPPQDRPDWGIRTAHFRDPEGNLIELYTQMPRSEWTEELQQEAEQYRQPQ